MATAQAAADPAQGTPGRNPLVMGCWAAADKGDRADLKLAFRDNGALVQYDENQPEQRKRSFGAWQMATGGSFLVLYWPNGNVSRYIVKRIGPILHFTGLFGEHNFTLRAVDAKDCWQPVE